MLDTIFATKMEMSQAWSKEGKRLPVTKLQVADNIVVSVRPNTASARFQDQVKGTDCQLVEVGYGKKKLKNMKKPLAAQLQKSGFSFGVRQIEGVNIFEAEAEALPKAGESLKLAEVLAVGDVVEVQGQSKGRGFAGAVKRHGFHGGPKTHGQSDRLRAVGSIGSGTTPGRIWKGKRMPGHMGTETKTVTGLVVIYLNEATQEVWLNGPVPGFKSATVRIRKTGKKSNISLDERFLPSVSAEVPAPAEALAAENQVEVAETEVSEAPVEEVKE